MKKILTFFLLSIIFSINSQTSKNEFSVSGLFGLITSNDFIGTPLNYDDYPSFSGVNLKCESINGLQLQYQHFSKKNKWCYTLNYERRWLNYSTTLYSMDYNPNTEMNRIKELRYNTQIESFSAGGGRRFVIPNSKFAIDLIATLSYQFYQDKKIGSLNPIDFMKTSELETGDFNYFVELDYSYYAKQLKFSAMSSLKYAINPKLDLNCLLAITSPIVGEYDYKNLTRGYDEEITPGLIVTNMESSSYLSLGRVATKYLSCGIGVNFKF